MSGPGRAWVASEPLAVRQAVDHRVLHHDLLAVRFVGHQNGFIADSDGSTDEVVIEVREANLVDLRAR
jgi:hypothetical protein